MGLINTVIILAASILLANLIDSLKKKIVKIPLIGSYLDIKNLYLYSIIVTMTLIMLIFL